MSPTVGNQSVEDDKDVGVISFVNYAPAIIVIEK